MIADLILIASVVITAGVLIHTYREIVRERKHD